MEERLPPPESLSEENILEEGIDIFRLFRIQLIHEIEISKRVYGEADSLIVEMLKYTENHLKRYAEWRKAGRAEQDPGLVQLKDELQKNMEDWKSNQGGNPDE